MDAAVLNEWRWIETAPRDGARILVLVRATEQGAETVDVVSWGLAQHSSDPCWVAVDSDAECQFVYTDPELVCWMPAPEGFPAGRTPLGATSLPEPPELGGSGI